MTPTLIQNSIKLQLVGIEVGFKIDDSSIIQYYSSMSSFQNDFGIVHLQRTLRSSCSPHKVHAFLRSFNCYGVVLKEKLTEIVKIPTDTVNIELSRQSTVVLLCAITQIKM